MFGNTYEVDLATMLLQLTVNAFLNDLAILSKTISVSFAKSLSRIIVNKIATQQAHDRLGLNWESWVARCHLSESLD